MIGRNPFEMIIPLLSQKSLKSREYQFMLDTLGGLEFFQKYIEQGQSSFVLELAKKLTISTFKKYDPIFFKGEKSTHLYIVASGVVWVMLPDRSKEKSKCSDPEFEVIHGKDSRFFDQSSGDFLQNIVHMNQEGSIFGELGMMNEKPRMATAIAGADCIILSLSLEVFQEILKPMMMQKVEKKNRFLRTLLSDYCNYDEIWRLSAYFEETEAQLSTFIVREGEKIEQFYIIASGSVELSKKVIRNIKSVENFQRKFLMSFNTSFVIFGDRQLIGAYEFAMGHSEFSFSAKVKEDSTFYTISAPNLKKCFTDFPSFKKYFIETSERIKKKLSVDLSVSLQTIHPRQRNSF